MRPSVEDSRLRTHLKTKFNVSGELLAPSALIDALNLALQMTNP